MSISGSPDRESDPLKILHPIKSMSLFELLKMMKYTFPLNSHFYVLQNYHLVSALPLPPSAASSTHNS